MMRHAEAPLRRRGPHEAERRELDERPAVPRGSSGQAPALLRAVKPAAVLCHVDLAQQAGRRELQPREPGGRRRALSAAPGPAGTDGAAPFPPPPPRAPSGFLRCPPETALTG